MTIILIKETKLLNIKVKLIYKINLLYKWKMTPIFKFMKLKVHMQKILDK